MREIHGRIPSNRREDASIIYEMDKEHKCLRG